MMFARASCFLFAEAEVPPWLVAPLGLAMVLVLVGSVTWSMMPQKARLRLKFVWKGFRSRIAGQRWQAEPCVKCQGTRRVRPYGYWVAKKRIAFGVYSGVRNEVGWVCSKCASKQAESAGNASGNARGWFFVSLIAVAGLGGLGLVYTLGMQGSLDSGVTVVRTGPFTSTQALNFLAILVFGGAAAGLLALVYQVWRVIMLASRPGGKVVLMCRSDALLADGYSYGGDAWLSDPEGPDAIARDGLELNDFSSGTRKEDWDRLESYRRARRSSEPLPPPLTQAIACSKCRKKFTVEGARRGTSVSCPGCQTMITVPR